MRKRAENCEKNCSSNTLHAHLIKMEPDDCIGIIPPMNTGAIIICSVCVLVFSSTFTLSQQEKDISAKKRLQKQD